jgi:hypothetical protein
MTSYKLSSARENGSSVDSHSSPIEGWHLGARSDAKKANLAPAVSVYSLFDKLESVTCRE